MTHTDNAAALTADGRRRRRRQPRPAATPTRPPPTPKKPSTPPTPTSTLFPDDTRPAARRIAAVGGTGYLRVDDIDPMNAAERRAYELLADGRPHTHAEIRRAVGGYDPMRRLRALRGRVVMVDGRPHTIDVRCTRGERAAGVYTLTHTPAAVTITSTAPSTAAIAQ
jgi:hypothetical protein